jgi:carbamoyltransferase
MDIDYIIGLNIGNHDSSAALLKNGELVAFAEQERLSRNKLSIGEPPVDALKYCLQSEGITLEDVTAIAIGMDWKYRNDHYGMPQEELDKYTIFENVNWFLPESEFGSYRPKIYPIMHHLAHAASAYRVSGFENSAVLIVDNRGEKSSASLGKIENGAIKFFKEVNIQNSLGIFYNSACRFTGLYGKFREVGKFMGLASYGIPNIEMPLAPSRDGKLFKKLPDIDHESVYDSLQLRAEQLQKFFVENCFPFEQGNSEEIMIYANFAASAQKALEDTLLDFVAELKEITGADSLVIAGGIAQNCSANGKIENSQLFKNIYVPPFASDAGVSVGAALELSFMLTGKEQTLAPLYCADLGAKYSEEQILTTLKKYEDNITFKQLDFEDVFSVAAEAIADGHVIGWMQGGFEAGPRALGHRSILADPRSRKSLIKLNMIKQREMWRPIAPSILAEHYTEYFSGDGQNKYFMNIAAKVKEKMQQKAPAIVHVDGTARPQMVTKENEKYHALLTAFYKKTGVPLVCNTSFNEKSVPVVNTPENALDCFLRRDIDMLIIENFVIQKRG